MSLLFHQIYFRYRRSRQPVFGDFSWQIPAGKTVLLGPNGAGKSTLLALGADALRPNRGDIRLQPLAQAQNERRARRAVYRRAVGWMPQQIRAVPGLTVQEQVAYAGWLKGLSRDQSWSMATTVLSQVDLAELAGRKTATLSGGQLRRVGLAQVLVHDPWSSCLMSQPPGLTRRSVRGFVNCLLPLRQIVQWLSQPTRLMICPNSLTPSLSSIKVSSVSSAQ